MRLYIGTFIYCGFFSVVAWSQSGVPVGSQPSPMEAFVGQPGVHTTWSSEVGRLENDGTRAVLTAIVVSDNAQPAKEVRGVKVKLSSGFHHEEIYLDEQATARTRSALEEIANAVAQHPNMVHNGCMGAREFWPLYNWPWNEYHELNADSCGDSKGTALVLSARGKDRSFRFPGENPTHMAEMLVTAMDQLKQH